MVSTNVKLLEFIFDGSLKPRDVKLSALESITQNFAEERIIGEGGFATVYKGILRNGEVAVKRIKNNQTIDEKLFRREVNSLLNVSHRNIVRFLGFCSHTEHKAINYEGSEEYIYAEDRERILCFEYINNGSLEKYTADELRGLPWDTRVLVIKGICEGLQYLHMKKHIIHMDLKPANILIDINMVAKITDFGLSRTEKNAQTKSTARISSLGYTAPEYIDKGEMSAKYDVYSLGIIIIELVTGSRNIPDTNNVLRRWRHRLRKSGKETPFIYQQIAKLIEIGLLCQENDPYKRPSISDIIHDINELENTDRQISNANESTAEQISPYLEDDMLGIEPLELRFPFELNNQISSSIELTNKTNAFIAFSIQTTSPLPYFIQPKKDIVAPRSNYSVNITLQSLDKAPQDRGCTGDFIVRSTKVNESLESEDITEDTFNGEECKLVDEVNLTIRYNAEVPQVDVSSGSLIISDKTNLHGPQESDVQPTEAESKIISSTSFEMIKFEPPEVSFPFLPSKCLLSSIKIVNITDSHIGFNTDVEETNVALYITEPQCGVLPPWSTQELVITRVAKEEIDELEAMQCKDKYSMWSFFVPEDVNTSDLTRYMAKTERKELPIVFTETSSNELIKFDPPELCLPLCPDQRVLSSAKIVNITDQYISFRICTKKSNSARYYANPSEGILPPLSTKTLLVTMIAEGNELEESQCKDKFLLWNGIVTENMKASDIIDNMSETKCTALPIVLTKTSSSLSDDLIQFDPPELHFPFLPNKKVLTSIMIVNLTDYNVGFNTYSRPTNAAWYHTEPSRGILPPRSTQKLMVTMERKEDALKDNQFNDNYFVWRSIVSDGVKDSELSDYMADQESKELPIVLDKVTESWMNRLEGNMQLEQVRVCTKIAIECMESDRKKRPVAGHIIDMLDKTASADETGRSSSAVEPQESLLLKQSAQEIIGKLAESLSQEDTKERPAAEDVAERLGNDHSQEGQENEDQLSSWEGQDTDRKTKSSVLDKLDIFNDIFNIFRKDVGSIRGLTIFTKGEIKKITGNYSALIGGGSSGKAYKGCLGDFTMVAVTVIKLYGYKKEEFLKQAEIRAQMIHTNILKLIGYCQETNFRATVHEYAVNGSLQEILHGNKNKMLSLDLRLDIAIGSAEGLRYMHSRDMRHGDVNPTKIFLGETLTPKISDFELWQLLNKDGSFAKSVIGAKGYIDPVYMKTGILTQKSDVYSLGAILLELITKKKVYSDDDDDYSLITEYCKHYEIEKSGRAMFDQNITSEEDIFILEDIGRLAIECLKGHIEKRPDMEEVTKRLVTIRTDRGLYKMTPPTATHLSVSKCRYRRC